MVERNWKNGDYAMHRGFPSRLQIDEAGNITLELVADYVHGSGICCGGYSSGGVGGQTRGAW